VRYQNNLPFDKVVTGFQQAAQQLSWERVNAVIKYLTESKVFQEAGYCFYYGQDGDTNTVDLQGTMEAGPNECLLHPNLREGTKNTEFSALENGMYII
jgi:hypothetical protein